MSIDYQIKKGVLGGYKIKYDCPGCSTGLNSSLDEAGGTESCPECGVQFVVPGATERDSIRSAEALAAKTKQEEKQRKREEKQQKARLKQEVQRAKNKAAVARAAEAAGQEAARRSNEAPSTTWWARRGDSIRSGLSIFVLLLHFGFLVFFWVLTWHAPKFQPNGPKTYVDNPKLLCFVCHDREGTIEVYYGSPTHPISKWVCDQCTAPPSIRAGTPQPREGHTRSEEIMYSIFGVPLFFCMELYMVSWVAAYPFLFDKHQWQGKCKVVFTPLPTAVPAEEVCDADIRRLFFLTGLVTTVNAVAMTIFVVRHI